MHRYLAIAVALSLAVPPSLMARQHVVDRAEIAARLQAAEAQRASNQERVEHFLSAHVPALVEGEARSRLSAGFVRLSDAEVQDLAARADALEADPVAGGTTKTLIIIGAIVLVVALLWAAIVKSCKEQGAACFNK